MHFFNGPSFDSSMLATCMQPWKPASWLALALVRTWYRAARWHGTSFSWDLCWSEVLFMHKISQSTAWVAMASIPCMCTYYKKQEGIRKKKKKHHLISQIVCPSTLDFRFRPTNWVWHSEIQFVIMFCWFHLWWNASTNRFVQKRLYCSHLRLREDGRPKCLLSGARLKHQTS